MRTSQIAFPIMAFLFLLSSFNLSYAQPGPPLNNLADAGDRLGEEAGKMLKNSDNGDLELVVATFLFGSDNGQITRELSEASVNLQSHIMLSLAKFIKEQHLESKYNVIDRDELDSMTGGFVAINVEDPNFTRTKAAQKGIGVSIIGTLKRTNNGNDYSISARVVTPTKVLELSPLKVNASGVNPTTPGGSTKPSGRFSVEVYAKPRNGGNFQRLELKRAEDQSGKFRNILYLVVDRQKYFGQPYEIHLKNHETKSFTLPDLSRAPGPDDKDRVFAAAVYIDGVSSFLNKGNTQSGIEWKKDSRHPAYVPKHVLTASERKFVERRGIDNERFKNCTLVDSNPPGHSKWRIRGFQQGRDTARSFIFGTAAQSVGVGAGQNISQFGLISIYFYAEELTSDMRRAPLPRQRDIGTPLGPEVSSPTFKVEIKNWYQIPAEVWHIQYAYEDDTSIPDLDPTPVF